MTVPKPLQGDFDMPHSLESCTLDCLVYVTQYFKGFRALTIKGMSASEVIGLKRFRATHSVLDSKSGGGKMSFLGRDFLQVALLFYRHVSLPVALTLKSKLATSAFSVWPCGPTLVVVN